jgi:hypothetical protein
MTKFCMESQIEKPWFCSTARTIVLSVIIPAADTCEICYLENPNFKNTWRVVVTQWVSEFVGFEL